MFLFVHYLDSGVSCSLMWQPFMPVKIHTNALHVKNELTPMLLAFSFQPLLSKDVER